jgi:hypothetical protein
VPGTAMAVAGVLVHDVLHYAEPVEAIALDAMGLVSPRGDGDEAARPDVHGHMLRASFA